MPTPNSGMVVYGPGKLYVAPIGTTEPTTLTAPWVGWYRLGYTVAGSTVSYGLTTADIQVAEALDPIATLITDRNITVAFQFAEFSYRNLVLSMNGEPSSAAGSADGTVWSFEPVALGQEKRVMLGWDSDVADRRYIFRRAFQSGSVSFAAVKGATLTGLDASFKIEIPTTGLAPFKIFGAASLNAASPAITG